MIQQAMGDTPDAEPGSPSLPRCSRTTSRWSSRSVTSSSLHGASPGRALSAAMKQARFLLQSVGRTSSEGEASELSPSSRQGNALEKSDSDSIMGEVQERMVRLDIAMMESTKTGTGSLNIGSVSPRLLKTWTSTADSNTGVQPEAPKSTPRCCPRVPFRPAVIGTVVLSALLACILMFVPLSEFSEKLSSHTLLTYNRSIERQKQLIQYLTATAADGSHSNILKTISTMLSDSVLVPTDRAIEALWGTMRTLRKTDLSWQGTSERQRATLAHRALVELLDQRSWGLQRSMADYLYAGFAGEQFAGASIQCLETSEGTCVQQEATWYDAPGENVTKLSMRKADLASESPLEVTAQVDFWPTQRPWYKVQASLARQADSSLRRAWSELYLFVDGKLGLTRTAPVAYCGNYSCFEGVVAADITLPIVTQGCVEAFSEFQELLNASAYKFRISLNNSAVFVVSHTVQAGLLVGASDSEALHSQKLTKAEESPRAIVRTTAVAILQRFGAWNSSELMDSEQFFTFSFEGENESSEECAAEPDCMRVGTLSFALDDATRWLVVLVSPAAAFNALARSTEKAVNLEVLQMEEELQRLGTTVRDSAALAFILTTAVTLVVGFCLSTAVSRPLQRLSLLLRRLGELDFTSDAPGALELRAGSRSHFRDVSDLQDAFCRLSHGIETFARFVPEAVVRNIIRGEARASRLHVSRREVTIMFSDIKDFTAISESLCQKDLIFMLTRYLSIMSRIVESFGGVVAEILGDGLLVYWNTPQEVEDHAAKACAGALAMQQALGPLNLEMSGLGLPLIEVRIGVNTGQVLSGTFGSDKKMKFGCMGDPVNLASRLEGLCKVYGAGIICSGMTHDKLNQSSFICRRLDLVQVKGRREPVLIYEVMGCDADEEKAEHGDTVSHEHMEDEATVDKMPSLEMRKSLSEVSERFVRKMVSAVALEALEDSRLSLHECPGFDWDQVMEQRQQKMERRRQQVASSQVESSPSASLPRGLLRKDAAGNDSPKVLRLHARRYEAALDAYQAQRFHEAMEAAEAALADRPGDVAATRLLKLATRCAATTHRAEEESCHEEKAGWTPVSIMTEK
eukprot:TRINITY_DN18360_c0_g1_i1.p1 TRINITY_DN18360_c0_g1~~TRINITY_DN18360_c0_g1_i1.p1  ORF type:complete len:1087 (-),score=237.71 TRINITY_DN18360_c0_g1_i1:153-3413(-)